MQLDQTPHPQMHPVELRPGRFDGLLTVMRKEMLVQRRQMRVWWRMLLLVGFVLVCFGWLLYLRYQATTEGTYNMHFDTFFGFALFISVLAIIQVLPVTAGAIARERECATLDMLLTTPLRGRDIVGGKLLVAILPVLTVLLAFTLVAGFLLSTLGGNSWDLVIPLIGAGLNILFTAALGLLCSTWLNNTARAISTSFGILGFFVILPFLSEYIYNYISSFGYGALIGIGISLFVLTSLLLSVGTLELVDAGRIALLKKSLPFSFGVLLAIPLTVGYYALQFWLYHSFFEELLNRMQEDASDIQPVYPVFLMLVFLQTLLLFFLSTRQLARLRRQI